jgi:hypothetical protein
MVDVAHKTSHHNKIEATGGLLAAGPDLTVSYCFPIPKHTTNSKNATPSTWSSQDYTHANTEIRKSNKCNARGLKIHIPTKINHNFLQQFIHNYKDHEVIDFIKFGWPLNADKNPAQTKFPVNHKSAKDNPKDIEKFITKAHTRNSILGPFTKSPFDPPVAFSPLGAVDKKDTTNKRIINDMSFPHDGTSVNAQISQDTFLGEKFVLKYPGVDKLVELIKNKGTGCAIFKRDISSAYRQLLRADPGDVHLLGFTWKGKIFHDLTLPQGCRSAALSCQRFTEFLIHIYQSVKNSMDGTVYQDDMADAETWSYAHAAYSLMGNILTEAGIDEALDKRSPPDVEMTFLGVQFNTLNMTLTITPERLTELNQLLLTWLAKSFCTKKELQSFVGKLQFAAACVKSGRIFLARMFSFMKALPDSGLHPIHNEFHKDVIWWHTFMAKYNGVSIMLTEQWSQPDITFTSDSCLSGFGAWNPTARTYMKGKFPTHIIDTTQHINQLELLTIVLAAKLWGHTWRGKRILVRCDNEASCMVINNGKSKDAFMMSCVREMAFVCATTECEIKALHIPGVKNPISDLLSRWKNDKEDMKKLTHLVGPEQITEVHITDELFTLNELW